MAQTVVGRYMVPVLTGSRLVFTVRQHGCTVFFSIAPFANYFRANHCSFKMAHGIVSLNWLFIWPAHLSDAAAACVD